MWLSHKNKVEFGKIGAISVLSFNPQSVLDLANAIMVNLALDELSSSTALIPLSKRFRRTQHVHLVFLLMHRQLQCQRFEICSYFTLFCFTT